MKVLLVSLFAVSSISAAPDAPRTGRQVLYPYFTSSPFYHLPWLSLALPAATNKEAPAATDKEAPAATDKEAPAATDKEAPTPTCDCKETEDSLIGLAPESGSVSKEGEDSLFEEQNYYPQADVENTAVDNLYQDMNDYRRKAGAAPLTRDYGMEEIMGNAGCSITKGHGHNTKEEGQNYAFRSAYNWAENWAANGRKSGYADQWYKSTSGHKENMLNKSFKRTGCTVISGCHDYFIYAVCQYF